MLWYEHLTSRSFEQLELRFGGTPPRDVPVHGSPATSSLHSPLHEPQAPGVFQDHGEAVAHERLEFGPCNSSGEMSGREGLTRAVNKLLAVK